MDFDFQTVGDKGNLVEFCKKWQFQLVSVSSFDTLRCAQLTMQHPGNWSTGRHYFLLRPIEVFSVALHCHAAIQDGLVDGENTVAATTDRGLFMRLRIREQWIER
ncbi:MULTISPECIES: hypothetical protein [Burkholderia]|uniref:hypothetical protein n=1 Tax=Burkholderia TaxID=32008 RepID=UPI001F4722C4|nr:MULTISPECIES: hypothetical protein [Burkholderia]